MGADRKLVSYVRSSLDNGVPLSRIRSDLYGAGWPIEDIEDAIASAGAQGEAAEGASETPLNLLKSRKFLYACAIIAVLLGAGISAHYASLSPVPSASPAVTSVTCGDGRCEGAETYETCTADCGPGLANANVSMNPPSGEVIAGENITFLIEISGVSNLYGFELGLNYDPGVLWFAGAEEGAFLNGDSAGTSCTEPEVSASEAGNRVSVKCTRLGPAGGVSGSGVLESLTFSAVADGTAQPALAGIKLTDSIAGQT